MSDRSMPVARTPPLCTRAVRGCAEQRPAGRRAPRAPEYPLALDHERPVEHLGARVYPDMFSLAQAHKALDSEGLLIDEELRTRFETNIVNFMDSVEANKHYPCVKKAWSSISESIRNLPSIESSEAAADSGLMSAEWPRVNYEDWGPTCDTLHAHTQVLGKLAAALAPPEPQLQHAALRLSARGWETAPLPAPDGSGALVVLLNLRIHEAVVEHSDGRAVRVALTTGLSVGGVTREVLGAVHEIVGAVDLDLTPQEVPWRASLEEDEEHTRYDPDQVSSYFAAATYAALVLTAFRAPYRGRSTPVNAWWGSFDLAVNLFSGRPADPPSEDFITRNAMDAEEVAVGWWPGDARYGRAAFYAYAHPAPEGFADAALTLQAGRWDPALGEFILDWDDVCSSSDPHGTALQFARSTFLHACALCGWNPALSASAEGIPPPVV